MSRCVAPKDDDQAFWALLLPESEMRAVERALVCNVFHVVHHVAKRIGTWTRN